MGLEFVRVPCALRSSAGNSEMTGYLSTGVSAARCVSMRWSTAPGQVLCSPCPQRTSRLHLSCQAVDDTTPVVRWVGLPGAPRNGNSAILLKLLWAWIDSTYP